jgi:hypothetical protein
MNLQVQKTVIIEQFKLINDENLLNAIKNMLDFALNKEQEIFDIPEEHKEMVMQRFDMVRKEPERLLDWNEAKEKLTS